MSDPSGLSGRPLASNFQQAEGSTQPPLLGRKRRRSSQSSVERVAGTKSTSRRRPGSRKEASGPHSGSSRGDSSTMQRSTSPTQMSPEANAVNYTRTGRISKAKKGLKVHNCECGRSYTRAEHLRRHQKNHNQDALVCDYPECGKTFFRLDLLQRHQERHNELDKDSRRPSLISHGTAAEQDTQVSAPVTLPSSIVTTLPQHSPYFQQPVSPPLPESTTPDPRYNSSQFRTPKLPSSTFGPVFRSLPSSHAMKHRQYSARSQAPVPLPVPVEGLQTGVSWTDPFNQSPQYSSSSGYASPVPGPYDHTNMFANPPYGPGANRTRTSSNASFIEPWAYPSRSPTSATSTMAYTWTSNDKSPAPASLPYLTPSSYPMASMPMSAGADPMYMHFGTKSMAQRDEEEGAFLFPNQPFGMGHIADTYPCEQYLDNYWRLFHPSFPLIHRPTFAGINDPPMLRAAMIAVGAQYSNEASAKRKSRILHDRCLKLLDKRDLDVMTEPERLCDYQALLLIEVLSQYRARRAAKTLSNRFENMYQKFAREFRMVASSINNTITNIPQHEDSPIECWSQWIHLCSQQRLLLCSYILEYQQATLLARQPQPCIIQVSGLDLPLPAGTALWEASTASEWAMTARQSVHYPIYVYDVTADLNSGPLDSFQSLLLIAAHYHHFGNVGNIASYLSPSLPNIDHLLDDSPMTKYHLLTAKLLQVTPIRSLLAVSGESWILSEKVPSIAAFSGFKATLRAWVSGLWSSPHDAQSQAAKDAIKWAIELLQHAMVVPQENLRLEVGPDMALYYAALVIWAVTVAANSRLNAPQPQTQPARYASHSPLPSNAPPVQFPANPSHLSATSQPNQSPNPTHPATIGLVPSSHTSPAPPSTPTSMSYADIAMSTMNFLTNALLEVELLGMLPQWPRDVAQWQQGCGALMRWIKMRLRNGAVEGRNSVVGAGLTSAGTGRGGDGLGELLDGVIGVLEKVMSRGWEGWGV